MIHALTKIQYMDVNTEQVFTDTIGRMFQRYYLKAKVTTDMHTVIFNPEINLIKITDMTGWTDVKAIRKVKTIISWTVLGAASNQITLSENRSIPIYSPDTPTQGFHGETKYPYIAKPISEICDGDMGRVRRGVDGSGNDIEFTPISFTGIAFGINKGELDWGYEIETKSGFFNANNIHLLADKIVDGINSISKTIPFGAIK